MSALTDTAENQLVDWFFWGQAAPTLPASWHYALFTVAPTDEAVGTEVPVTSVQLSAAGNISLSGAANLNVSFTNLSAVGVIGLTASAFLQVPVQLSSNGTISLTGSANIPAVVSLAANGQTRLTGSGLLENAVGGTLIGIGGGSIASLMEYNQVIGRFKIGVGAIVVILSKNGGIVKE